VAPLSLALISLQITRPLPYCVEESWREQLQGRVRGPVANNDHMRLRRLYSEQLLNEAPAADTMVSREYLFPFACFACRHSFRRPFAPDVNERPCPHCGAPAIRLARKFKAPPTSDKQQWEKVRFLVAHGFRFWSVHNRDGLSVAYPKTLKEAKEFVRKYAPRAPTRVPLMRRSRKAAARQRAKQEHHA
jgi:hypothetical protein